MKRKLTLILLTCIACLALLGGVVLTACKDKGPTYAITWNVDEHVTVKADGYDSLPESVKGGTEILFTATPANGYEITSVAPSSIKKDGEKYKLSVEEKDVTVTIKAARAIESVKATFKEEPDVYYAGDTISADDLTVNVTYKDGITETVTTGVAVIYTSGAALSLGDTSVNVSYRGYSDTLELGYSVVGKVTLNLNGGTFPAEELTKLPAGYKLQDDKVIWTFDKAYTEDYVLPSPQLLLDEKDPTSGLPFDKWSGVGITDNKIPAETATSLTAGALYNKELVNVTSMRFEREQDIPYLVIEGEFVAATSAYLYIYEGNEPPVKYDPQITVTKQAGDNHFALKMNLAELAKATPAYAGDKETPPSDLATSFINKWLDIRFCVTLGKTTIMQELFLTDENDENAFADRGDSVFAQVADKFYKFSFKIWEPTNEDPITGSNGAFFTGTEKVFKLYYEETEPYNVIEVNVVEKEQKAQLEIVGEYYGKVDDKEALQTFVNDTLATTYMQSMKGGWPMVNTSKSVEVTFVEGGPHGFKIYMSLENVTHGDRVYFRIGGTGDSNNLESSNFGTKTIQVGNMKYTLNNYYDWGSPLVVCDVEDLTVKSATVNGTLSMIQEGEKVYLVINGTYKNYSEEEIKAALTLDTENANSWEKVVRTDLAVITVNGEDNSFTIKVDITDIEAGEYLWHVLVDGASTDVGNEKGIDPIVVGGKSYSYKYHDFGSWNRYVLTIEDATPEE